MALVEESAVTGEQGISLERPAVQTGQQFSAKIQRPGADVAIVTAREQDAPHGLFQLAHIARPGVARADVGIEHFVDQRHQCFRFFARRSGNEMPHEFRKLRGTFLQPLAEGRDGDDVWAKTIEEVVAKQLLLAQRIRTTK